MVVIEWGQYNPPIKLQWGELAGPTEVIQQIDTPNPIAVMIATAGTAAPVFWSEIEW